MDQQYEQDFKLTHVVLSEALYLDPESKQYLPTQLDLFGHCYEVRILVPSSLLNDGRANNGWMGIRQPTAELDYGVVETDGLTVTMELDKDDEDTIFRLELRDYKRLKAHYDEMNATYIQEREDFKQQVMALLHDLMSDPETHRMGLNFLRDTPPVFFLSPEYVTGIECVIERRDEIGRCLLMSDELQRSKIGKVTHQVTQISDSIVQDKLGFQVENEESINPYFDDRYLLFAKLIMRRLSLKTDALAEYLTYVFLDRIAREYFSSQWADNYQQEYFPSVETMSLFEAIGIYCRINTINPDDVETKGQFIYYLMSHGKFEDENFLSCVEVFGTQLKPALDKRKLDTFADRLSRLPVRKTYTIDDVDLMNGLEFEAFIALLFQKTGYATELTKASGDQGIDLIASRAGVKIGIQAKCYSGSVGNGAVQEAVAGIKFYHLDKAIVVTNRTFTDSAVKLANSNGVVLWNRSILKEKIAELL